MPNTGLKNDNRFLIFFVALESFLITRGDRSSFGACSNERSWIYVVSETRCELSQYAYQPYVCKGHFWSRAGVMQMKRVSTDNDFLARF